MMTSRRDDLGFRRAVLDSFGFLVDEYGFRSAEEKPTLVRYESDTVGVRVYHGRQSYELDVEFIDLDGVENAPPLKLLDVLRLEGKEQEMPHGFFQSSKPGGVRRLVDKLAQLTREYASEILRGNRMYFRRLSVLRSEMATKEELRRRASELRHAVDAAWRSGDYSRVVELFEELEEPLTPAEKKKLEIARRKASV